MIKLSNNQFVLCCRGKKCPIVTVQGETVEIVDDYEQKVRMTKEQFMEISKVVEQMKENS